MIPINGDFRRFISFFDDYGPNQPVIDSILAGFNPGSLWVDKDDPNKGALLLAEYGFAFGWGNNLKELLYKTATKRKKALTFVPKLSQPEQIGVPSERIEFFGPNNLEFLKGMKLPPNASLISIDATNLKQSNWMKVLLEIHGSASAFENSGGGIALTNGKVFMAEALIGFVGKKYVDIGTVTHADHRSKGYSTLVCGELIKKLNSRGLLAYWSCNTANLGSMKVAEKLGFAKSSRYKVFAI